MKKSVLLILLLFLTGCAASNDVTEDFNGKVFNHSEETDRQVAFLDDQVIISPVEVVSPFMSEEDLNEATEEPEDYESQEFENIEIHHISNNEYEVIQNDETVLNFVYDQDANTLEIDDNIYVEQTAE